MIYIVEIAGPSGERATTQYEAPSIRAAIRLAEDDLQRYPHCEIVNIRLRAEWDMPVDGDEW
jgi:hypothetical protein